MKTLQEIREILQSEKTHLAREYGVTVLGVFGSYVRGEQRAQSDIDLLIALEEPPRMDLFDLVNLEDHLSQLLGVDVDIAIKQNLRRRIGQRILSEVVPV
jgi:uncharacterized protein